MIVRAQASRAAETPPCALPVSAQDLRRYLDMMRGALVIPEFLVPYWTRQKGAEWKRIIWDDGSHRWFPQAFCGVFPREVVASMAERMDAATERGAVGEIFGVDRSDLDLDSPRLALVAFKRLEPLEILIDGAPKSGHLQVWETMEFAT